MRGQDLGCPCLVRPESEAWVRALRAPGVERQEAVERLHALLLRIARTEVSSRSPRLGITGPELDDLAHQAAADALLAITAKIGDFRGESRFTAWAYKFVILKVSAKIGRHFWRDPGVHAKARTGSDCPTDSASTRPENQNGATCSPRCAGQWRKS